MLGVDIADVTSTRAFMCDTFAFFVQPNISIGLHLAIMSWRTRFRSWRERDGRNLRMTDSGSHLSASAR